MAGLWCDRLTHQVGKLVLLHPFLGEGSPSQIDKTEKSGYSLILTSLVEDLDEVTTVLSVPGVELILLGCSPGGQARASATWLVLSCSVAPFFFFQLVVAGRPTI